MTKRFVVGDIHENHKALIQVLKKSGINKEEDLLYILGDVVDGHPDVKKCIMELTNYNHILILGNHDVWFMDYLKYRITPSVWIQQGGKATVQSINSCSKKEINIIKKFFKKGHYYHVTDDNILMVHGGYNHMDLDISKTTKDTMLWDRGLINHVRSLHKKEIDAKTKYKKIFVGHTTTQMFKKTKPITMGKLTMMDTGAGGDGRLSIMDIDNMEYWCSDLASPPRANHLCRL